MRNEILGTASQACMLVHK